MTSIGGWCLDGFEPVEEAFRRNFDALGDVGAAIAVSRDGQPVVNLWGGLADPVTGRPWDADTLVVVFSTTKGLAAAAAILLWERGDLDLDAPVAEAWPEFAGAGKERVTTRHLLTHQAGLAALAEPVTFEQCHDGVATAARLAAQAPDWEPGTAHGYHALTYGWLVGEVVRRVSGRPIGRYFADEIAGPLGLDTYIGLPAELEPRVARLQQMRLDGDPWVGGPPNDRALPLAEQLMDPGSLTFRVFTNPPQWAETIPFDTPEFHQSGWPGAGGITTAASLARFYGELACDRVLSGSTLDEAERAQVDGFDLVLRRRTRFGLGFALPSEIVTFAPGEAGFGHDGAGGSVGFADRRRGIGFGYVMNQMGIALGSDDRVNGLVDAVYSALGERV